MAASGGAPSSVELPPIDVLIVVALQDELEAVLAEGGGAGAWRQLGDHVYARALPNDAGQELGVAAAWVGAMGAMAAASRAAPLVERMRPSCLAMCGICAGRRGEVALGDVIVADRVYAFDHGKLVAAAGGAGPADFFHDLTTYSLERAWQMDAAALRRELGWAAHLLPSRPPTKGAQARWLLRTLDAHEREGGPSPLQHPEAASIFRIDAPGATDWADRIRELRAQGLLAPDPGVLALTSAGRLAALEERLLYPRGAPGDPLFRVHVGPIATGNAVIEDPEIFERLRPIARKTLGVEMESFAIGYLGDALPRRAIVAKAVSDHADRDKDDRFREFACRASAAWLLAFLRRHLAPKAAWPGSPRPDATRPRAPEAPDVSGTFDERPRLKLGARAAAAELYPVRGLQQRVERALAVRYPGARAIWKHQPHEAMHALRTFLELHVPRGGTTTPQPVAVVEGDVGRSVFDGFVEQIVSRYRADAPFVEGLLVHTGAVAADVGAEARRRGVHLESLTELQRLLDFRTYVAEQTRALESDPVYPSRLFVPQRLASRAGSGERVEDDALGALAAWLEGEGPRLGLVLGDFGTGKTFLMHELALRLARRPGAPTPILVELRRLEKSRSLDALLGQHFIPERGMRRFDHAAFRYMLEEGRIALLFDGFDELALRVTYAAAAEHLETLLAAAAGKAKVVITSRTQHFLNDQQVLQALGERVTRRGFRLMRLLPFAESQIQQFLVNRFGDDAAARQRLALLGEVRDLLGLSHNPRMLGFISEIDEADLRAAAQGGAITSATLYRVLLERWLGHEDRRDHPPGMEPGISVAARWRAATELARLLWTRRERTISVGEIPHELLDEVERLSERPLGRDAAAFKVGTGTLLGRDEAGRFSFIHQSIVEWLVASAAAEELRAGRPPSLLAGAELSDLMADFLWGLAGKDRALAWARGALAAPGSAQLAANATRLLRRLGDGAHGATGNGGGDGDAAGAVIADLAGHDLRGRDLSGTSHLRGGRLAGADLSEASLVRADLSGADLANARLTGANLAGANLAGARLPGADLSFARLLGADLTGADLADARLRHAALVGARVEPSALAGADTFGAALPRPGRLDIATSVHFVPCGAVAWSPDGALLAAGYQDGAVVLWDAATGSALRTLGGHAAEVRSLAFSPDGRLLASGSADHTVRLWCPEAGRLLTTLDGHAGTVRAIAFSPDGHLLASGSADHTVRLWDPAAGRFLRVLERHAAGILGVAFSPDGRLLASSSADHTVRMRSPDTGQLLRALEGHAPVVRCIAFSPDGRLLASGSADATVRLWSPQTGQLLHVLEGHAGQILGVAFSPDGRLLASGSADHTVRLWNPDAGRLLRALEGHAALVRGVAFSPDGRLLASGSADHTVRLWRPDTGHLRRTLEGPSALGPSVALAPDARALATGSADHTIRLWRPDTGRLTHALEGHAGQVLGVAFSPDGRLLASGGADSTIRLWSSDTGAPLPALEAHAQAVLCLAFSPGGRLLASGSVDRSIRLWNPGTGKLVRGLAGAPGAVRGVAFSPDGALLAAASDDALVRLWSPESGQLLRALEGHAAPAWAIAFSPAGDLLAAGAADGAIRLWSPATGRLARTLEPHPAAIATLAFSPTGLLASGAADGRIRLWRPDTGRFLCALDGHAASIWTLACSADGRLLASVAADGTIRLWSLPAALRGDSSERGDACLAILIPGRRGWAAYAPDGRYKLGGDAAGLLGFTAGLCRFEPGELDAYPDAFDRPPRRIAENAPLFTPEEASPTSI